MRLEPVHPGSSGSLGRWDPLSHLQSLGGGWGPDVATRDFGKPQTLNNGAWGGS